MPSPPALRTYREIPVVCPTVLLIPRHVSVAAGPPTPWRGPENNVLRLHT
jgi:hypothetical protein